MIATVVLGTAGCAGLVDAPSPGTSNPAPGVSVATRDAEAIGRAAGSASQLGVLVSALTGRPGRPTDAEVTRIVRSHGAQNSALGAAASVATPGAQTATAVADQERQAARAALADVPMVSPGLAVLLTRIAAADTVHATLLDGASPATPAASAPPASVPSPGASAPAVPTGAPAAARRAALTELVAAEHAAVFGYGMVAARLPQARRPEALAVEATHRGLRDGYAAELLALGGVVPAAQPGYVLTETDPARLAAAIEAAVYRTTLHAVAQLDGAARVTAARDAVAALTRQEQWASPADAMA